MVPVEEVQAVPGPAHLVADSPEMAVQVASGLQIFPDQVESPLLMVGAVAQREVLTEASVALAVVEVRPGALEAVAGIQVAVRTTRPEVPLTVKAQAVADLLLQVQIVNW
jgi:hypothetical protein